MNGQFRQALFNHMSAEHGLTLLESELNEIEQLFLTNGGLPFVVIDPTGAWYGLRSSADGRSEGIPVIIIGGSHGDLPLEPTAGKTVADLVVDHPGYYVIDPSQIETLSRRVPLWQIVRATEKPTKERLNR
jgi:hypothetical protein